MNWEAVGAIAESLSALGVIVSLLYLATQIRHSLSQTNADAIALINDRMHGLTQELRQNPGLYAMLLRASQDWDSLTEEEQSIAHLWFADEASLYETAWILWGKGTIDDTTYRSREDYFVSLMMRPGRAAWWKDHTFALDPRFYEHIDQRRKELANSADHDLLQRYPFYKPAG